MSYEEASKNPDIVRGAPVALNDAKQTLDRANVLANDRSEKTEVTHMAYLVKKKVQIAQATADSNGYDEQLAKARQSRGKIVLDARTRDTDRENERADAALLQSQKCKDKANVAQSQAIKAEEELRYSANREARLREELAGLMSKETDMGTQLTLRDMMFDIGKSELTFGGVRDVSKIALIAKQSPNREIVVEGHTDSTGSDGLNQDLSERRARSVEDLLKGNGVDGDKITSKGYGKAYPIATNATSTGRQLNRRVVVTILREGKKATDLQGN